MQVVMMREELSTSLCEESVWATKVIDRLLGMRGLKGVGVSRRSRVGLDGP
jgi:hypothetical protein